MPKLKKEENNEQFVNRCIPIVIKDKTAKDGKQAFAVCNDMWDTEMKKPVKERKYEDE